MASVENFNFAVETTKGSAEVVISKTACGLFVGRSGGVPAEVTGATRQVDSAREVTVMTPPKGDRKMFGFLVDAAGPPAEPGQPRDFMHQVWL